MKNNFQSFDDTLRKLPPYKKPNNKTSWSKVLIMMLCHEQWLNMSLFYCTNMKVQLFVIAESAFLYVPSDEKISILCFII